MITIKIDRSRKLVDEPRTGHNRWHPDVAPIVEVAEGEEVGLETRDGLDGFFSWASTAADIAKFTPGGVHPLTGPVGSAPVMSAPRRR